MFVNEKLKQFKVELNKLFEKERKQREKIEFERKIEMEEAFAKVVRDVKKGKFFKDDGGTSKFDEYFVNHNKNFLAKYESDVHNYNNKERLKNSRSVNNL